MDQFKEFEKWLDFLSFLNDERKNKELLSEYLSQKFAQSPERFFAFLQYYKNSLDIKLAKQYLEILSPLCERFGFLREKHILDDLCFKLAEPKNYQEMEQLLSGYKKKSQKYLDRVSEVLIHLIKKAGFKFEIKGRYKNLYSTYKKILRKDRAMNLELKDIFAFRIILKNNSVKQCFEIVDLLHDNFYPITDYFKDYITIPKVNGYQSLHTGLTRVIDDLDLPIEVQIRTKAMHDFAEKGLAAHWIYVKNEKKVKMLSEKEKMLIEHLEKISRVKDLENFVYFFSYKGDIFKMPRGVTLIDFAYNIHSNLGNKLEGALVNGSKKSIAYKIQDGDKIELLKGENERVHKNWLNFTNNKHTRKKIYEKIRP